MNGNNNIIDKKNDPEKINRNDVTTILEVNKKAIELKQEMVSQQHQMLKNQETVFNFFKSIIEKTDKIQEKVDKLLKQSEETDRNLFKIQILFLTGVISIIVQVVNLFLKKP